MRFIVQRWLRAVLFEAQALPPVVLWRK